MKKILNLFIAGLLALTLLGCQSSKEDSLDFDSWVDSLVLRVLDTDSISFNFFFINPEESLGVSKTTIEWPTYDVDEYLETVAEWDAIYEELLSYDRDILSDTQKETYDVLEFTFRPVDEELVIPFYYLSNNVLGNYVGLLSDPIIDLYYFNIYDEVDIENYIHLMETLTDFAYELIAFEKERQDNGYGMTPEEIELSIESVKETLEVGDFSYLAEDFTEKVEAIDLEETIKAFYIEEVTSNIGEAFISFYEILLEGLENLDIKQESGVTLYDLPYGSEYYASLVYEYTGIEDMDEFYEYLKSLQIAVVIEILSFSDYYDYEDAYIELDSADEVIAYLKEAIADDFPEAADVEYQMIETPDGLEALMSGTTAYYLLPAIDDATGSQSLAIVGEYDISKFTTIAHEGYPGHMYQNVYMASLDLPYIRTLLYNSGYTEGYASYAEYYSVKYSADPEKAYLSSLWTQYTYYIIVEADYLMHYAGEDAETFLSDYFYGISDLYKQLQMSPAIFVKYDIAAAIIADLRDEIEEAIGEEITDLQFHTAILSHGNMPLQILREYVLADFTD